VESVDVAPTLARVLGVSTPSSSVAACSASIRRMIDPVTPLATSVCGISLRNPVIARAARSRMERFEKLVDLNAIGGW